MNLGSTTAWLLLHHLTQMPMSTGFIISIGCIGWAWITNPHDGEHFYGVMKNCFYLLAQVLIPGAYACFLIGKSVIRGELIDNASIVKRAAVDNGFVPVATIPRNIPVTRKSFNPNHASFKSDRESLVIVQVKG